jgi:arabinofuranan 3-O-arabinosyltransferase
LAGVCLGLTLLVFTQRPGEVAPDTKLDLVVAPGRFLDAALRMWDPRAGAGQMQDQAYGYLFPMGPVFLLGKLAALPPWVVQRTWESALIVAAFLGVVRLSRLLGVPGFWPRVGAGLAYSLAPRMLTEIGSISAELLPVAVLPWVLVPLVRGAVEGSPRRAAARSGVALLCAGGINAAATVAILPVPVLWLLTRSRGRRKRALAGWWLAAVACASLWWVVPLLVLGRYSPPFLDWIESSAVTTSQTGLLATLRGVDHWQAYLGPSVWPGGWILVSAPAVVLATSAVAALGLAGIAGHRTPHRTFLLCCLLLGLALVTVGHAATVGPPFAGQLRTLLDGPLNAFRNVHKFDPVLRLAIAVGVGHAVAAVHDRWAGRLAAPWGGPRALEHGRTILAVALVGLAAVASAPALTGRLVPSPRSTVDPVWWKRTGEWLGNHAPGRALVVPGAATPAYVWGAPHDDALQPYADGTWTVRNSLPLAQPGYIRLLDAIETKLRAGAADPTLAPLLARAGIRYLVVRNDLDTAASGAAALRFVHATIAASGDFRRVAGFGSRPLAIDRNRLIDLGLTTSRSAVDVYLNEAWTGQVRMLPASAAVLANGSADNLGELLGAGLPADAPVVFGDPPAALRAAARRVSTDGIRRREFGFGGIDTYSNTLTAHEPFSAVRSAHDYLPARPGRLTTARYSGIADVTASTAASDAASFLYRGAAYSPWAALDGERDTAWFSASASGAVGQWLRVDLPTTRTIPRLRLRFAPGQRAYPTRLRVTTDGGQLVTDVSPSAVSQEIPTPPGRTRTIRLTVLATTGGVLTQVGIAGLVIPGVRPERFLVVPGTGTPDAFVFRVADGARSACLTVGQAPACHRGWAVQGEEQATLARSFALGTGAAYRLQAGVRLRPGASLDALLDGFNPVRALASSVESADPRERAGAAVDGNPDTGWIAAPNDRSPTIVLRIAQPRPISGVIITPFAGAPATRPTEVLLHVGRLAFTLPVPPSGRIELPAAYTTSTVAVTVVKSTLRISTDSLTGAVQLLPVGIGELRLLGSDLPVGAASATVTIGCDAGLAARVDGVAVPLTVQARAADVLAGREVVAQPCAGGALPLAGGRHSLTLAASALALPESLTLARAGARPLAARAPSPGTSEVRHWGATDRSVRVATHAAALLVVPENQNGGWHASLGGTALRAVTLDGWEQGWLLPAGARGTVHLTYAPQRAVDWGLLLGLAAALLLLAGALVRGKADAAPLVAREASASVVLVVGAVGLAALGGVAGLAVLVATATLAALARSRGRPRLWVPAWSAALALAPAGLIEAWRPVGSGHPAAGSAGAQLLCLLALALGVVALIGAAPPRTREPAKQRALEQVPGRGRGARRGEHGQHVQTEEVSGEHRPAHPPLDGDQ